METDRWDRGTPAVGLFMGATNGNATRRSIEATDCQLFSGAMDREIEAFIRAFPGETVRIRDIRRLTTTYEQVMTGAIMLETLDKMFLELDELDISSDVVSCPHTAVDRPDTQPIMYCGRRLDFCKECDHLIRIEFHSLNVPFYPPSERTQNGRQRARTDSTYRRGGRMVPPRVG